MDIADMLTFMLKLQTLVDEKDFDGAEELVDELLLKYPDMPMLLFTKALCLDAKGQFSEAFEYCRKARDLDDSIVPDDFYTALEYKVKNAPKTRTPKRVSDEKKIPSLLNSGANLIERQEFNKAKAFFDRVLGIDGENIEAIVCKAYCINKLGKIFDSHKLIRGIDRYEISPEFLKFYDELKNLDINDARPNRQSCEEVSRLCDEGFRHIEEFEIKDAKSCFNRALKIDENDVNPVVGNAYCLFHLGYYVLSLKECRKAIDMDIESVDRKFYRKVKAKVNEM